MRIVITGELPGTNEIVRQAKLSARAHYGGGYTEEKREITRRIAIEARSLPACERVRIMCHWYCANKRKDPDNVSGGIKYILDGLVESGVLMSDRWSHVAGIEHRFDVDRDRPRVEVELEEVS